MSNMSAMKGAQVRRWLPTSRDEMERMGWDRADIIIFSGDAYVDHPSFGAAVIGRSLEAAGYRVAVVPQPNWRDDLRDFKKLGRPRLFFGVSAGAMDSMVNHYTANRRLRHDDAYTPGGRHGMRPDYPTVVYSRILRDLYPDVPIIAGGIEASLRRVAHYDYWQDCLRPPYLLDTAADMIVYGMGEKAVVELARRLDAGERLADITDVPQTVFVSSSPEEIGGDKQVVCLNSYEDCLRDKKRQAANFRVVEEESNRFYGRVIFQRARGQWVRINPMYPPLSTEETDASFDLPYTRLPHPRYRGKRIPAYDMIRHSICMHRGCFGGCAFCTISAHQGKHISSRSKESILKEARQVAAMDDFKGYISDLGGPSANMYAMRGRNPEVCKRCLRPSCLHPIVCPNLNTDHGPLLDIYRAVDSIPGVKKSFVGSGVRYDLAMHATGCPEVDANNREYIRQLICNHVSGRLKVAPEHTSSGVLEMMRKPSFGLFRKFKRLFDETDRRYGLRQQLIPYFISSHPGCRETDMAELAVETKSLDFHLEQVQDFTPTPMTVATETYYTGYHPYTLQPVYTARTKEEKLAQRQFFFWYKPEARRGIVDTLRRMHRPDLLRQLYGKDEQRYDKEGKRSGSSRDFPQKRTSPSRHRRRG